jgi:hypothetical protein
VEAPPCAAGSAICTVHHLLVGWILEGGFWQVQGALFLAILCVTTDVIPEGSRKELSLRTIMHASSFEVIPVHDNQEQEVSMPFRPPLPSRTTSPNTSLNHLSLSSSRMAVAKSM